MPITELELAQRFAHGDDTAARELMRLWELPLTKAGFTKAAERMIELIPGFPDAIQWDKPHNDVTALNLFANTLKP